MKLGLKSDFRDFYDHWFDKPPCDYVLDRVSTGGLNKRQQFQMLEDIGFSVPLHGLVKDIWSKTSNNCLVVYTDEQAHRGEGKTLYHCTLAVKEQAEKYCSIFIPTTEDYLLHATSRRLLAIGERMWWIKYESSGDWRSNYAFEVNIAVLGETLRRDAYAAEGNLDFSLLQKYPLFAIDFVESLVHKQLMAIDFNSAPGLKHTGIQDLVSSSEIVRLIRDFAVLH